MTDKHSFVLYDYIKDQVDTLTDEERGQLFKAVLSYVTTGEMPQLDRVLMMVFIGIRNDIDRANEKWQTKRAKLSEAGKRGAESRSKQKDANPDADLAQKKERALSMLWGR